MTHNTGTTSAPTGAAALSVAGPQAVWMTLNEARERAFTGEIVFELDPEVHAYLDQGIVYYAERSSDDALGRRLLAAGVVDAGQLERGTVRVGDVEHLGRLFDRDPSIDRDAVVVVAEGFTEELITELANGAVASVRVTAYRHHSSGIHRWFVAPVDSAALQRPMSAISQIDTLAIEELPVLPFSDLDDELTIEWDEPIGRIDDTQHADGLDDAAGRFDDDAGPGESADDDTGYPTDVLELSLELAEFSDDDLESTVVPDPVVDEMQVDIDVHDVGIDEPSEPVVEHEADMVVENGTDVFLEAEIDTLVSNEVDLVVEDRSEMSTVDMVDDLAIEAHHDGGADDFAIVWPEESDASPADDSEDAEDALEFEMPPLSFDDEVAEPDPQEDGVEDDVPDDVAEAVRRAIAAIETASLTAPPAVSDEWTVDDDDWGSFDLEGDPAVAATPTESVPVTAPDAPAAGTMGFAPPTMDMRAEVLYQQASEYDGDLSSSAGNLTLEGASASPAPEGASSERTSALRRLIGGLRRGDR
jgi:hypothetical protein